MSEQHTSLQDAGHAADHNYDVGSPHLTHAHLRGMLIDTIRAVVAARQNAGETVRVLEVGAGHGAFTDHVLALGAHVTVTEMSRASADILARRYEHNPAAEVIFDETGSLDGLAGRTFDVVLSVAVLHHIPDYLAAIEGWLRLLAPGGSFLTFQDPLYYPRRTRASMALGRGSYYVWRVLHGDLLEGAKSFARRKRGAYDEENVRDMVEYHVLRDGVDEQAVADLLRQHFGSVEIISYFSTPSPALQRLGERFDLPSDFGIRAEGYRG